MHKEIMNGRSCTISIVSFGFKVTKNILKTPLETFDINFFGFRMLCALPARRTAKEGCFNIYIVSIAVVCIILHFKHCATRCRCWMFDSVTLNFIILMCCLLLSTRHNAAAARRIGVGIDQTQFKERERTNDDDDG